MEYKGVDMGGCAGLSICFFVPDRKQPVMHKKMAVLRPPFYILSPIVGGSVWSLLFYKYLFAINDVETRFCNLVNLAACKVEDSLDNCRCVGLCLNLDDACEAALGCTDEFELPVAYCLVYTGCAI